MESTGSLINPYTYTGRELDPETQLYYYRERYYNPRIGRFLSEDPIGFLGGVNFYSYCHNNPINWIDPWGLCKEDGRKGITSQDILDMLLGVGTAYAGELTIRDMTDEQLITEALKARQQEDWQREKKLLDEYVHRRYETPAHIIRRGAEAIIDQFTGGIRYLYEAYQVIRQGQREEK